MNTVSDVMNHDPIFCTQDTRVAEVKHLLKKYNHPEILVVDSAETRHPVGLIALTDMEADEVEHVGIPSDVSALECMRSLPAVVAQDSSLDECLNVMRSNHLERIAVVDFNGHVTGMIERADLRQEFIH